MKNKFPGIVKFMEAQSVSKNKLKISFQSLLTNKNQN